MPTGYTNMLDTKQMDTKTWIMRGLARAYGMCVTLREASFDLTEEQIIEKITKWGERDMDYHRKELVKANNEYNTLLKYTLTDWHDLWVDTNRRIEQHNEKNIKKANRLRRIHDKARTDLKIILGSGKAEEITKAIAEFGIKQLDLVERECEPYIQKTQTLEELKESKQNNVLRDISYHADGLKEARSRSKERLETYLRLRKNIDEILC